jgi:transcriptional regulator with XRE-family HTH domain
MNDQWARLAEIGARIAVARRASGLTQGALADRLGVPLGIVDKFELGRSDPSKHIVGVAEATGRSAEWLLTGSEAPAEDDSILDVLGEPIAEARQGGDPRLDPAHRLTVTQDNGSRENGMPEAETSVADQVATSVDEDVRSEPDELDRVLASLAYQRDELRRREAEADRRAQELDSRAAELDDLQLQLWHSREEFEQEWSGRLREFEELQRRAIELATTLADRATALRQQLAHDADAPEPVTSAEEQPV